MQDLLTGKTFDTHIANLSPFNFDPHRTDPADVAMHDKEEFEIDSIIAHRGDRTRRKTLQFLVRWRGYAPEITLGNHTVNLEIQISFISI